MGFSPINNYNSGNNFKSDTLSRSFNDGTEELLRNVLGGSSLYDYKRQDGDSLSLSPSGKKQLTQEDVLVIAQQFQNAKNDPPEPRSPVLPQAIKDFFIRYAAGSGEKVYGGPVIETPDSVKNFFQAHTLSDLRNMSLDQIPDDVKEFVKIQTSFPNGQTGMSRSYHGIDGIHTVNPDDMARKLVNSLFVNASKLQWQ